MICVLPFLPPKPEGLTMGPVDKFLTSEWFVQQNRHLLRLLVSLQFLYCRWQCDSRATNVDKLPGTSEYKGIGKYVPERVEHHLIWHPASEAKRGYLKQRRTKQISQNTPFISFVSFITGNQR